MLLINMINKNIKNFTCKYCPKISNILASKFAESIRTKSQAALLLVSTSDPSISLLIYSSALSANNSSSDATLKLLN